MKSDFSNHTLDRFVSWVRARDGISNAFWAIVPDNHGEPRYVIFCTYVFEGIPYQFSIAEPMGTFRKKTAKENTENLRHSYESIEADIRDNIKNYVELKEALNEINREHGYNDRVGDEEKTEEEKAEERYPHSRGSRKRDKPYRI